MPRSNQMALMKPAHLVFMCAIVLIGIIGWMQRRISALEDIVQQQHRPNFADSTLSNSVQGGSRREGFLSFTKNDDEYNVRMPTKARVQNGAIVLEKLDLSERLRYLELKTNAWMNWGNYYDMEAQSDPSICSNASSLIEFNPDCGAPEDSMHQRTQKCPGLYDHNICLDNFPPKRSNRPAGERCIVYDFGIRQQPEFGVSMADHFGCEVHAFDPSPISTAFAKKHLTSRPNYHFHPYGAGGRDGSTKLFKYNWGQVSTIRFPMYTDKWKCLNPDIKQCSAVNPGEDLEEFSLQVKTLPTIMKELGHTYLDMLKIDVEGSEYVLLEQMFDVFGCPPVNQITLEWHHFWFDPRYGAGSSPSNNAIVTMLHRCGFRQFSHHLIGGWPTDDHMFQKLNMDNVRYNIVSFMKVNK